MTGASKTSTLARGISDVRGGVWRGTVEMSQGGVKQATFVLEGAEGNIALHSVAGGITAACCVGAPERAGPCEDAAVIMPCGSTAAVLAVADGAGGRPAGHHAAQLALAELVHAVQAANAAGQTLRAGILNGIEHANQAVMDIGVGAATTLVVVEVEGECVRPYHVGDSSIFVVGRRGKVKLQTIAHSPVGYAVEAGLLDEADALHHEDRHIVSNVVGSPDMRIEIGSLLRLRAHDTLLLATDGLTDNLHTREIVDRIRVRPLARVLADVMAACADRMCRPSDGVPSKPDDMACILFRLTASKSDVAAVPTDHDTEAERHEC